MTEIDLSRAEWRKSSHSSQDGNCVEVARNLPGLVAVRDSKEPDGAKAVGLAGDLAGLHQERTRLATHPRLNACCPQESRDGCP
jgi:hypothetical protein